MDRIWEQEMVIRNWMMMDKVKCAQEMDEELLFWLRCLVARLYVFCMSLREAKRRFWTLEEVCNSALQLV